MMLELGALRASECSVCVCVCRGREIQHLSFKAEQTLQRHLHFYTPYGLKLKLRFI